MDIIQDWATYLFGPQTLHNTFLTASPYLRQFSSIFTTAKSYLTPLITQISTKPDLATLALCVIILFVSLKILNMLYQAVMFWFRMAYRVLFWGALGGLALWIYTRGPEGVVEDVQWWVENWQGEYRHWKEQERVARLMQQRGQFGGGRRW